jgi:hypothetical protein
MKHLPGHLLASKNYMEVLAVHISDDRPRVRDFFLEILLRSKRTDVCTMVAEKCVKIGRTIVIGEGQSVRILMNQDAPLGKVGEHHLKLLAVCLGREAVLPRPRTTLYGRLPWILREEPGKPTGEAQKNGKSNRKRTKKQKTWYCVFCVFVYFDCLLVCLLVHVSFHSQATYVVLAVNSSPPVLFLSLFECAAVIDRSCPVALCVCSLLAPSLCRHLHFRHSSSLRCGATETHIHLYALVKHAHSCLTGRLASSYGPWLYVSPCWWQTRIMATKYKKLNLKK